MSDFQHGIEEAGKDISEYGLLYAQDAAEDFREERPRDMFALGYRTAVTVEIEKMFWD